LLACLLACLQLARTELQSHVVSHSQHKPSRQKRNFDEGLFHVLAQLGWRTLEGDNTFPTVYDQMTKLIGTAQNPNGEDIQPTTTDGPALSYSDPTTPDSDFDPSAVDPSENIDPSAMNPPENPSSAFDPSTVFGTGDGGGVVLNYIPPTTTTAATNAPSLNDFTTQSEATKAQMAAANPFQNFLPPPPPSSQPPAASNPDGTAATAAAANYNNNNNGVAMSCAPSLESSASSHSAPSNEAHSVAGTMLLFTAFFLYGLAMNAFGSNPSASTRAPTSYGISQKTSLQSSPDSTSSIPPRSQEWLEKNSAAAMREMKRKDLDQDMNPITRSSLLTGNFFMGFGVACLVLALWFAPQQTRAKLLAGAMMLMTAAQTLPREVERISQEDYAQL
jgi:hypothetical protein